MRYLSFVGLLCAAYFIYAPAEKKDPAPSATVARSPAPAFKSAPSTDFLKRPLDRTHEVLDQVRTKTTQESGF